MTNRIIVNIDGMDYDFTPYTEYETIGGYFGFIGANGEFYRVRELNDVPSDRPHNVWAREFIKFNNLKSDDRVGTSSTALVKKYGFVLYTSYREWDHCGQELFILPNIDGIYNAEKCSVLSSNPKQIDTINKIIQSNLETEPNYRKR